MSESNDDMFGRRHFEAFISAPPFDHMCERFDASSRLQGLYKRYETQIAWEAWREATKRCLEIVERYQVPIGNSAAGELAREWTMEALRQIREEIAGVLDNRPILNKGTPDDRA